MKRLLLFLVIIVGLFSVGCRSLPSERVAKAQQKVEQTKAQIQDKNDAIVDKTRGYIFGADFALSLDNNPNKYSTVAKDMTGRARLTLGDPSMEDATILRDIINNLLSTNQAIIVKGQKALAEKDSEVTALQNNIAVLQKTLEVKEQKSNAIALEMSKLGDTWFKIKRVFYWVVWIIGIGLLFSVLSKVLPPPYNSIAGIIYVPFGLLSKLIHALFPAAKQVAGVVASKTYEETKKAFTNVVDSIEQTKEQIQNKQVAISTTILASPGTLAVPAVAAIPAIPPSFEVAAAPAVPAVAAIPAVPAVLAQPEEQHPGIEQLKTNLRSNLDEEDKKIINRTKEDLGYL